MTLWIIGMMGAGKTTAGEAAARVLDLPFLDTDAEIAQRLGCSIAQLWGELGEGAFREMERVVVAEVAGFEAVVSTGGGAPLDERNRNAMSDSGRVLWLRAKPELLAERVGAHTSRPLLANTGTTTVVTLTELLKKRASWYSSLADHEVDTDNMSVDEVAGEIARWWLG